MAREGNRDRGLYEWPKGSGIWWIEYHHQGRRHREKVGTKSQARLVYGKRKAELREGRFFPPQRRVRPVTVEDVIESYLEVSRGNRSRKTDLYHAELMVGAFGDRHVEELRAGDVEHWLAARSVATSPSTANRSVQFLRRTIRRAVRDGLVAADPTAGVKLLREPPGRVRYLTSEEETRLRAEMPPDPWLLVEFAIHTGLRRAEQFGLRWENVDFRSGNLTIPRSKSGQARHVKMNSRVRAILRELPSRLKSEWVFPSLTGSPMDANNFVSRHFRPAIERARIRDFHWHDCRHTFASRLVMAGKSLVAVHQLLGHSSIKMTMIYAHLAPEHLEDAVEVLVAIPEPPSEPPSAMDKDMAVSLA